MSGNTLTPEQQNALRVVDLITGIGGPEAYLESLQPINANYDTSAIDANFKTFPPIPAPIPFQLHVTPNYPFKNHYTVDFSSISKLFGATTWHASGISYAPGAIDVTVKDWSLFLNFPWSLDKLVGAPGIKFRFRTNPELPGILICDIISGELLVGSLGGKIDPKEAEALNSTSGAMHWWKTFPYPPFQSGQPEAA